MKRLLFLAGLALSCAPPRTPPPREIVSQGGYFVISSGGSGGHKCRKITLDDMPCIICTAYDDDGAVRALTCGWPK